MKTKRKKKLGNYPYASVILSTVLALFIIGMLGVLVIKANKLKELLKSNVEVQVYLNKFTSESERVKLEKSLATKDYVGKSESGVPQISFISKDSAAVEFVEETGEDFLGFLDDNPLLDAYLLKISPDYFSSEELEKIKIDLESFSEVYEVIYQKSLIETINANITRVSIALGSLAVIMIAIVVILVNNTIRLAMFSQRFLIRSMQLVGAKPWFVKKPFLKRSILYSIISGILSCIILYGLIEWSYSYIEELKQLFDLRSMFILVGVVILTGMLIVSISTLKALNKYLKLSLDDLY